MLPFLLRPPGEAVRRLFCRPMKMPMPTRTKNQWDEQQMRKGKVERTMKEYIEVGRQCLPNIHLVSSFTLSFFFSFAVFKN